MVEEVGREALERELASLRERVGELQRRVARFAEPGSTRRAGELDVSLSEREELLAEAERLAHMGSWIWNLENGQVYWSDEMFRVLGYDPAVHQASSDAFFAAVHVDDRARLQASGASPEQRLVDYRIVRPDGTIRICAMDSATLFDGEGRPRRMVGAVLDVTEAREQARQLAALQERLAQAEKMEAIGRLAGGIAHDFNNLLMVMQANLDLLRRTPSKALDNIGKAVVSARTLTERLLTFGRRAKLRRRVVDLNALIHASLSAFSGAVGKNVAIGTALAPEPVWADVDEALLEQALLNLVLNARDALTTRGRIEVGTRLDGPEVVIWVRDDGVGMDEPTRQRIFEPFFTTKPDARGTGLGLPMVLGAVEQHGGSIQVESDPGRGSTFLIRLPSAAAPPREAGAAPSPPTVRAGRSTILIVEDQAMVASALAALLTEDGHEIMLAEDPEQALELLAARPDLVDLILCDVIMPVMRGPELVRQIRVRGLAAPRVLFMSGFIDVPDLPPGCDLIAKPFAVKELCGAVARALASPASKT